MRRILTLLLFSAVLFRCSDSEPPPVQQEESRAAPPVAETVAKKSAPEPLSRAEPAPERVPDPIIALRRYEQLRNDQREMTFEVRWTWAEHEGRRVVKDVTRTRLRTARMMGRQRDIFEEDGVTTTLRTEDGHLISMVSESRKPSRTDRSRITRMATGYDVEVTKGDNSESFSIPTDRFVQVDAETFIGPKIRAGEATPGTTWTFPFLATGLKRVIEITLRVVGPDPEGPGLKVVQTTLGRDSLWWFADDGSVVRHRAVDTVIRRDDSVGLDDLPARPAAWRITLPANVNLPRIFTGRKMIVDIEVETDETTRPPIIPTNPFTEVVETDTGSVRALLKSHDFAGATTALPIDPKGHEEHLKPTPLMEVDDPVVIARARSIVGDEKDARAAATKIADFVFRHLQKGSPDIGDPTAKQILDEPVGDCSEHALLFTALCRAAGIPARRCSGYVCIGNDWGAHAWTEIWLGRWIGADPTTNEIGTRARYIFLSRQDDHTMVPGSITAERTEVYIRRVEYDDGILDFEKGETDVEVYSGIRLGEVPEGWKVQRTNRRVGISGDGVRIEARISPDHGYRNLDILVRRSGMRRSTLGSREVARRKFRNNSMWIIPLGRQNMIVQVMGKVSDETLAKLFAPTLDRNDG